MFADMYSEWDNNGCMRVIFNVLEPLLNKSSENNICALLIFVIRKCQKCPNGCKIYIDH